MCDFLKLFVLAVMYIIMLINMVGIILKTKVGGHGPPAPLFLPPWVEKGWDFECKEKNKAEKIERENKMKYINNMVWDKKKNKLNGKRKKK